MDQVDRSEIWFAVINVFAASERAAGQWEKAECRMKDIGMTYHGCRTGKAGNAMEITFDACMAGYRKFVAVGGDGTVHDVLNGIASYVGWSGHVTSGTSFADFTIGVIPVGSGNDWIRSAGVPADVRKAVDVLHEGYVVRQDVVKVSMSEYGGIPEKDRLGESYMINIGGVGLDARVCELVNAKKRQGKRGRILYITSLLHAVSCRKPAFGKVICDGNVVFNGAYLSMAFGIGRYSGGGMRQTPEAVMDDGLLDVTIIPDIALGRIAREIPRLFTGTFLKVPELTSCKCRSVTVLPGDETCCEPVEVDGEVVGKAPVTFEVLDSQINVVACREIMRGRHQ